MGNPNRHTTLYVRHGVVYDHACPLTVGCCQDCSNCLLDIHSEWYLVFGLRAVLSDRNNRDNILYGAPISDRIYLSTVVGRVQ